MTFILWLIFVARRAACGSFEDYRKHTYLHTNQTTWVWIIIIIFSSIFALLIANVTQNIRYHICRESEQKSRAHSSTDRRTFFGSIWPHPSSSAVILLFYYNNKSIKFLEHVWNIETHSLQFMGVRSGIDGTHSQGKIASNSRPWNDCQRKFHLTVGAASAQLMFAQ